MIPHLVTALSDSSSDVRGAAVRALARFRREDLLSDPATLASLTESLNDTVVETRQVAIEALAVVGGREGLEGTLKGLTDSHADVRVAAAEALASLGDDRAVDSLLEKLQTERNLKVRNAIVKALETYAEVRAIPALVRCLSEEYGTSSAERYHKQLVLHSLSSYPVERVVNALLPLLEGELNESTKVEVIRALARIEHPRIVPVVLDQLKSTNAALRREAVIQAGKFLDARALPTLVELLRDPDSAIRGLAQKAIEDIRYYEEQRRLLASAEKAGDPLKELLGLLKSEVPAVRLAAVQAVARTRAPEALPALVRLRKDEDAAVREAVERALVTLTKDEKE